jgi:hypothetical protein
VHRIIDHLSIAATVIDQQFVLLPRNTARNVLFALMRFPFLQFCRFKQKFDVPMQVIDAGGGDFCLQQQGI